MKGKAKRFKSGGRVPQGDNAGVYSGASSNVVKEAKAKGGGFKAGGKVAGGPAMPRMDRKARGGAVGGSPFSSAAKLSNVPGKGHSDSKND